MLVVGALAVIRYAERHGTRRPWLVQLMARRPTKVAAVALANKMARMVWAIMTSGEPYREPVAAGRIEIRRSAPTSLGRADRSNAISRSIPGSGKTHLRQGASERVLLVGTRLRGRHYGQRPMRAAPTGRTHGRTDQPRRSVQESPCQRRAVHTWHFFGSTPSVNSRGIRQTLLEVG